MRDLGAGWAFFNLGVCMYYWVGKGGVSCFAFYSSSLCLYVSVSFVSFGSVSCEAMVFIPPPFVFCFLFVFLFELIYLLRFEAKNNGRKFCT